MRAPFLEAAPPLVVDLGGGHVPVAEQQRHQYGERLKVGGKRAGLSRVPGEPRCERALFSDPGYPSCERHSAHVSFVSPSIGTLGHPTWI